MVNGVNNNNDNYNLYKLNPLNPEQEEECSIFSSEFNEDITEIQDTDYLWETNDEQEQTNISDDENENKIIEFAKQMYVYAYETLYNNLPEPVKDAISLPERALSNVEDGDFESYMWKQNYIFNKALVSYYNGVNEAGDSADEVYKNKQEGFIFKQSDLSEEEQKEARLYAIELLETRITETEKNRPDYGDCEEYYNYGSFIDWLVTHPVSLGIDKIAGEDSAYHKFFYEDMAPDGMLTALNIPYYILSTGETNISEKPFSDTAKDITEYKEGDVIKSELSISDMKNVENYYFQVESGIRLDDAFEIFKFRSIKNIDIDLNTKKELLQELIENVDNPEEFSRIFYQITDGKNFSADEIFQYKRDKAAGKETKPLDVILGRNYLEEDYAKNKLGTRVEYSVNKQIGTTLMKKLVPGGAALAVVINTGLDVGNELTKNNPDTSQGNMAKIVAANVLRSFPIKAGSSKLLSFGLGKTATAANSFTTKPVINSYANFILSDDSSIAEKIEQGNYLSAGAGLFNSLTQPEGQISLVIEGIESGYNLTSDIEEGNTAEIIYDIAQVTLNPSATIAATVEIGLESGDKVANGDAEWLDYVMLGINPVALFSAIF